MKKLALVVAYAILLVACATTQPASSCPDCPATPPPITKHDTLRDSIPYGVPIYYRDTTVRIINSTPGLPFVLLSPDPSGDSYPELQAAIDNYINTGTGWPLLTAGNFYISHPLIAAKRVITSFGTDYAQVSLHMEGAAFAKNTPTKYTTNIFATFTDGFALGIQKGKGCLISNIAFYGMYQKPSSMTTLDIDTLPFEKWGDGRICVNRASPYSGICIEPFGNPASYDPVTYVMYKGFESWYLPDMSRGGSTAIQIRGCSFNGFAVGTMITPSSQANGEEIDVIDCAYMNCISAYSTTQAQSKANTLTRTQVWGGVHTIIDAGHWGFRHGDGAIAPMVDVMNVAGVNYELIIAQGYSFPVIVSRVYGEGLFKIGWHDTFTSATFRDFQIDFQNGYPGVPTPDYYDFGRGTSWEGCMLRLYNGGANCYRLIWGAGSQFFNGGSFSGPPITGTDKPVFSHTQNYYGRPDMLDGSSWDSTFVLSGNAAVYCDRSTFNGYIIGLKGVKVGDVLLTNHAADEFPELVPPLTTYPLGFVVGISGDTTFLQNMGVGIHTGMYLVRGNRPKTAYQIGKSHDKLLFYDRKRTIFAGGKVHARF